MNKKLRQKMCNLFSVRVGKISYDEVIETFTCECGCGMELSAFALTEMRQPDRRLFKRMHRILRNGKGP